MPDHTRGTEQPASSKASLLKILCRRKASENRYRLKYRITFLTRDGAAR
ncbi:hypothetical protein [Kordiimonas pumila]|nr:hypothetical protein [Kordiimonas pumila]